MIKQKLHKHQPQVFQTLHNALDTQSMAHAYLFVGEEHTMKLDVAYLLVQSTLCPNADPFACEVCESCMRVKEKNYADLIYVDGYDKSIKKENIIEIQQQFSKTNVEEIGRKVYILDGVEKASESSMNTLLKFLEEPQSDTMAILIANHSDRVLNTIASRCQIIQFIKQTQEGLCVLLEKETSKLEAYILSSLCSDIQSAMEMMESEEFQHAMYLYPLFLEKVRKNKNVAGVFLQSTGFSKSKRDDKKVFLYFLNIMERMVKDSFHLDCTQYLDIWGKCGENMLQLKRDKVLNVVVECKDKIVPSVNILLLVDQFIYLWEV